MTPEQQIAGARLVHDLLTRDDRADPATDVVTALGAIDLADRGGVLLGATVYGVAFARAMLRTLEANGIDPADALDRHGETLALTDMYHRNQEIPDADD